ncbi:hypothetical protein CROQUDRAFT_654996 [Cronartium quercuum f. sp. fusiforme G11]|uniref:Integral membrane protein n=1 Tax=Cronartium quercuum f. sp. fusiforme G11 TaxID=708437 RepID=A0A9P6TDZ4_9BASI|nr:hypothetical protein CROQUDRAFT_654996 [Cronartium quercuum f. sp. fusiforme G11]
MLATGCSNSLWSKFQDKECVANCDDPDPSTHRNFEQPVWQTLNMFAGESLCLVAFYLLSCALGFSNRKTSSHHGKAYGYQALPRNSDEAGVAQDNHEEGEALGTSVQPTIQGSLIQPAHLRHDDPQSPTSPLAIHGPTPAPLAASLDPSLLADTTEDEGSANHLIGLQKMVFWLPTIFDICGTTLMNVGLLFVPVSVFQMIRGALPLWVGLFSVFFLKRTLRCDKWFSLAIITFGVAVVGFAGSRETPSESPANMTGSDDGTRTVLGVFLIFFAQLFTASQFVIEEKIMTKYEVPPLEAVGLEGIFGLFTTLIAIPVLHIFIGSKPAGRHGYFDANEGFHQIVNNEHILWSCSAIAISIALFNFCGLAVTKTISATVRSIIDTCRSIGIWVFSLAFGWEVFDGLQLVGFIILVAGTFLFNDIWHYPAWFRRMMGLEIATATNARQA